MNVLFTWELGSGLGHVMNLRPLVQGMAEAGHRVTLALRLLTSAAAVYEGIDVSFLQAPAKIGRPKNGIRSPSTFAQIIANSGFGDVTELAALVGTWRLLVRSVEPDLVVSEHSPLAVLASRGCGAKRVVVGHGFYCPADREPTYNWGPEAEGLQQQRDEHKVLANVNAVLQRDGQTPLGRLSDFYTEVDATLLSTFPELDAIPDRGHVEYWGQWRTPFGKPPRWPEASGERIFVYLKSSRALPVVFSQLVRLRFPTIVYAGSLDRRIIEHFQAPHIVFETEPLDLDVVARQCDLAIVNSTHGTVVQMLLAGTPIFLLPLFLEQIVTGRRVVKLGAGLMVDGQEKAGIAPALERLLNQKQFKQAAERFAERYRDFDSQETVERAVARLSALLSGREPS